MGDSKEKTEEIYKDQDQKNNGLGLGVVKPIEQQKTERINSTVNSTVGYKPIEKDSSPSKWLFNKPSNSLRIKPADWDCIKSYAMMDEENPESVNDHINDVLSLNCKVGQGSFRDLCFTDKLHTFFMVRDYTMMNNDNAPKIFMTFTSNKDGEKKRVEMNANIFEYFEIPKGIMKHYDEEERCFVINYDDNKPPMRLHVPKIGVIEEMRKYISDMKSKKQRGENVFLDKDFVVYAQFMIEDWRMMDDDHKYVESIRANFNSMSAEERQILDHVVKNIKLGIKPTIKVKFSNGNSEVFPLMFRKYKSLFFVSNKIETLFGAD